MHPLCPAAHCTKSKDSNVMGALTPLDALLAKKSCALSKFWPSFAGDSIAENISSDSC